MEQFWTLLIGLAVAAVPFVIKGAASAVSPRVKHMRRLGEVLEIYDKMDDGRAKEALDEVVHRHLVEVRTRYLIPFRKEEPGKLGHIAIIAGLTLYLVGLLGFTITNGEDGSRIQLVFALMFVAGFFFLGLGAWRAVARRRENVLKESRDLLGVDEDGNWTSSSAPAREIKRVRLRDRGKSIRRERRRRQSGR